MDHGEGLVLAAAIVGLVGHDVPAGAVDDQVDAGHGIGERALAALALLHAVAAVKGDIALVAAGGFVGDGLEAGGDLLAGCGVGGAEVVFEETGVAVQSGVSGGGGNGGGALDGSVDDGLLLGGARVGIEDAAALDAGDGRGGTGLGDLDGDLIGLVGDYAGDASAVGGGKGEGALGGDLELAGLEVKGLSDVEFRVDRGTRGDGLEVLLGEVVEAVCAVDAHEGEFLAIDEWEEALVAVYRLISGGAEVERRSIHTGVADVDLLHGGLVKERVHLEHVDLVVRRVGHGHLDLGGTDRGQLDVEASLATAHGDDGMRKDGGQQRGCGHQDRSQLHCRERQWYKE